MKSTSAAFRAFAHRRHDDPSDFGNRITPENALCISGANGHMDRFHALLATPNLNMKAFDEHEHLLTIIANGGADAAIWLADHARTYGLNLDRRDTFKWTGNEKWHTEHLRLDGHLDYKDRLHWQKGPYLRNTALILSLKKGWDHVSDTGKHGEPLSATEKAKQTKMGRVTQSLLRNGANPDIQDGCGNTALHIAMLHRDVRAVRALRDVSARNDLRNNAGLRPIDMLDVRYEDINPFLYQQTGNDVNCYIFTLKPRKEWLRAGTEVRQALQGEGGFKPAAPGL